MGEPRENVAPATCDRYLPYSQRRCVLSRGHDGDCLHPWLRQRVGGPES